MTIINMSGGKAGKPPVYQARTIQPTAFPTTVTPQTGYDALSSVQVNAPANLLAQNIRKDVNIAGVVGTYEAVAPEIKLQQKTAWLDGGPLAVTPDDGYDGLSQVSVGWDGKCSPENIRSGVTMFGVTGTFTGTRDTLFNGIMSWDFSNDNPTYPMIRSTRTFGLESNEMNPGGQPWALMGNSAFYAYTTSGAICVWGARPIQSNLFTIPGDTYMTGFKQAVTTEFNGSFSSNRDTSTMDSLLKTVSSYSDRDYFNGTMTCRPWWIWRSSSSWGSCISSSSWEGSLMTISFTYSNGRCTYTIPTRENAWNSFMLARSDLNPTSVSPVLYFNSMTIQAE